jgi:hypothetical protein
LCLVACCDFDAVFTIYKLKLSFSTSRPADPAAILLTPELVEMMLPLLDMKVGNSAFFAVLSYLLHSQADFFATQTKVCRRGSLVVEDASSSELNAARWQAWMSQLKNSCVQALSVLLQHPPSAAAALRSRLFRLVRSLC